MHLATSKPYTATPNPTLSTVIALGIYIFALFSATLILCYLHHHSFQENCLNYATPTIHWSCHSYSALDSPHQSPHLHFAPSPLYHSSSLSCTSIISTCLPLPPPLSYLPLKDKIDTKTILYARNLSNSSMVLPPLNFFTSKLGPLMSLPSLDYLSALPYQSFLDMS